MNRFGRHLAFTATVLCCTLIATKAEALASDTCIEKGGQSICVPTSLSNWCYVLNPPAGGLPPLRPTGLGGFFTCYSSEEEAIGAMLGYYSGMAVTGLRSRSPMGFVNGELIDELIRYDVQCPGGCPFPAFDIQRFRGYRCSVPEVGGGPDDPSAAPTSRYRDFRFVCPMDFVAANESSCPVGNPIAPGAGRKIQDEVDYVFGSNVLFSFSRTYDSSSSRWMGPMLLGLGWSSGAAAELYEPAAAPGASPTFSAARGPTEAFRTVGSAFEAAVDAKGKLTREVDASGNTVGWNFYGADSRMRRFRAGGTLDREYVPDGRSIRYTYDGSNSSEPLCPAPLTWPGSLRCITDDFGRQLRFEYDNQGRLVRMLDPSGAATTYAYNESGYFRSTTTPYGVLTSVTYPDGGARLYHYNEVDNTSGGSSDWLLTGISERLAPSAVQRYATFKYDLQRRAIFSAHAGGADSNSIQYTSSTARTLIDPRGTSRTLTFQIRAISWRQVSVAQPAGAGSSACSATRAYDTRGNLESRTEFNGSKTCYQHEATRNIEVKRVEGVPSATSCATALSTPPAGARIISSQWHPDWRLETRIAEPNKLTTAYFSDRSRPFQSDRSWRFSVIVVDARARE